MCLRVGFVTLSVRAHAAVCGFFVSRAGCGDDGRGAQTADAPERSAALLGAHLHSGCGRKGERSIRPILGSFFYWSVHVVSASFIQQFALVLVFNFPQLDWKRATTEEKVHLLKAVWDTSDRGLKKLLHPPVPKNIMELQSKIVHCIITTIYWWSRKFFFFFFFLSFSFCFVSLWWTAARRRGLFHLTVHLLPIHERKKHGLSEELSGLIRQLHCYGEQKWVKEATSLQTHFHPPAAYFHAESGFIVVVSDFKNFWNIFKTRMPSKLDATDVAGK